MKAMRKYRYAIQCKTLLMTFSMSLSTVFASDGTDGIKTALQADNLPVVAAGEVIYLAQCASCHGAQLEGQPNWRKRNEQGYLPAPPHDKTGHTWHHADDLLFEITKYGAGVVIGDSNYKTLMPAYEFILSDDEIIAVLSYIKNSWPEQERAWQDEINANQGGGFTAPEKQPSIFDKLFK